MQWLMGVGVGGGGEFLLESESRAYPTDLQACMSPLSEILVY